MTAMRLQYSAARARSWVINSVAIFREATSSAMRSMITAWVVMSTPVVGSSAISKAGSQANAIAIMTRWHMPPDNSNG